MARHSLHAGLSSKVVAKVHESNGLFYAFLARGDIACPLAFGINFQQPIMGRAGTAVLLRQPPAHILKQLPCFLPYRLRAGRLNDVKDPAEIRMSLLVRVHIGKRGIANGQDKVDQTFGVIYGIVVLASADGCGSDAAPRGKIGTLFGQQAVQAGGVAVAKGAIDAVPNALGGLDVQGGRDIPPRENELSVRASSSGRQAVLQVLGCRALVFESRDADGAAEHKALDNGQHLFAFHGQPKESPRVRQLVEGNHNRVAMQDNLLIERAPRMGDFLRRIAHRI